MSKNVAIFGSSGAIGDAFSKIFTEDDSINRIYNFSRKNIQNTSEKVTNIYIDIVDENSIKKSSEEIPQDLRFDIVIVATGILHNESDIFPAQFWLEGQVQNPYFGGISAGCATGARARARRAAPASGARTRRARPWP